MASRGYDYALTESAEHDLDYILGYISEELGNPDAASDLADEFEEQLEIICKRPLIGKLVENDYLKKSDIRRFLVKSYIAYYIIDEENERIVILRFVYSGRDQDKIVKDF